MLEDFSSINMKPHPKVVVGIISYNDQRYLEHNLPAMLKQDYPDFEILICNNFAEPEPIDNWLKTNFPEITVLNAGGNVGFGRAHNFMITEAKTRGADYYLCFNSDMVAEPDFISKLVAVAEADDKVGVVTGKLLSWRNFPNKPQEQSEFFIDTVGLIAHKNFHVIDRGQGEQDSGQYDQQISVFGASGAAPLFRIKMLDELSPEAGEFFDKHFFMYKEDVDLAMRIKWAGWKTVYTPHARAHHDRTAADPGGIIKKISKRRNVPDYIKRNSFLNQLLLTTKNWSSEFSLATKLKIGFFIMRYILFLLIFDRSVLSELKTYKNLRAAMIERREKMPRKLSASEFEQHLN